MWTLPIEQVGLQIVPRGLNDVYNDELWFKIQL